MKTYKIRLKNLRMKFSIPNRWRGTPIKDLVTNLSSAFEGVSSSSRRISLTRMIVGPNRKFLHILITPLLENEPELTVKESDEYFDGLSYRQNLYVLGTGSIEIAGKEHFYSKYYRMSSIGKRQIQFIKKYCLYLNRHQILITAGLYIADSRTDYPTDEVIKENESVYDEILLSIQPLKDRDKFY